MKELEHCITKLNAAPAVRASLPTVIASWPKNSRETLQVRLDMFKDQVTVDCRAWYAGSDGTLKPGRGGLTIAIRHLPTLASALAKATETARASGLIPGDVPVIE